MANTITPAQMAAAKESAAHLLRFRLQQGDGDAVPVEATDVVARAAADPDPRVLQALVISLVQFGWMTADFLTRNARGHELDGPELDHLLELFQFDTKG